MNIFFNYKDDFNLLVLHLNIFLYGSVDNYFTYKTYKIVTIMDC